MPPTPKFIAKHRRQCHSQPRFSRNSSPTCGWCTIPFGYAVIIEFLSDTYSLAGSSVLLVIQSLVRTELLYLQGGGRTSHMRVLVQGVGVTDVSSSLRLSPSSIAPWLRNTKHSTTHLGNYRLTFKDGLLIPLLTHQHRPSGVVFFFVNRWTPGSSSTIRNASRTPMIYPLCALSYKPASTLV